MAEGMEPPVRHFAPFAPPTITQLQPAYSGRPAKLLITTGSMRNAPGHTRCNATRDVAGAAQIASATTSTVAWLCSQVV